MDSIGTRVVLSNVSNWSKELLVKEKTTKRILSLQFHTQIPMSEITRSTIKAPLSFLRFSSKRRRHLPLVPSSVVSSENLLSLSLSLVKVVSFRFVSFRFVLHARGKNDDDTTQGERRKGQKCRFFAVKLKKKRE